MIYSHNVHSNYLIPASAESASSPRPPRRRADKFPDGLESGNRNRTEPPGSRLIPLSRGQWAIVDRVMFRELSRWKWSALWQPSTRSYVAVRSYKIHATGKRGLIYMHRQILGLGPGIEPQVDHRNHRTLENRLRNLRVVSVRGNAENRRDQSRYGVGVYWNGRAFYAQARIRGRPRHLGCYATAAEARAARARAIAQLGEQS